MLSMSPVGSAGGAAKYFAADNYYTLEESAEESLWYGEGAELLGLTPGDGGDEATDAARGDPETVEEKGDEAKGIELEQDDAPTLIDTDGEDDIDEEGSAPPERADEDAETGNPEVQNDADAAAEGPLAGHPGDGDSAAVDATPFDPDIPTGGSASIAASFEANSGFDPDRPIAAPGGTALSGQAKSAGLPLSNPSGKVDAKTFENILNGVLPDGTQVGKPDDRRLGMDLTFSMPKSASLLTYIGGDKRILEAHMGAVKTAMRWVEANLAEARVREDGDRNAVRTGNLVYALFQHDTSRALDPQGHVHAVIANLTRLPNGEWRSLHNGAIWQNNTVTSSVYHAAFRDALEKIGYRIELQGKHGTFEIAGVPKGVRDAFSQRREAILAKGAEIGIATPQGLREVTKNSRDAKVRVNDRDALRASWVDKAEALGWAPEALVADARAAAEHRPGLIERGVTAIDVAFRQARALVSEQLEGASDPLVDTGLDRLRLNRDDVRTQIAVASAIRILAQREAAFAVNQLIKTALDLGLSNVTPEGIAKRVTALIKTDQLVAGVREDLHVFTDDKDKLIRQIDRTSGNKTSALEVTGQLQVDKDITTASIARARDKPFDPGPIVDTSQSNATEQGRRLDTLYPGLAVPDRKGSETPVPQLSVPEKTKGMDI